MEKMKLFHVGFYILEDPDIHYGKKNADFGQGFYLSDDEDFSHRWAKVRPNRTTYINTYELDLSGLKVKCLDRDEEWFRYIFSNRRSEPDQFAEYDVVMGPIANDTIYDVMGITTSGHLKDEEALKLLQLGKIYRQIAIKTQKAKHNLKWLGADALDEQELRDYRHLVASEEREFQTAFAKKLDEILN